MTIREAVRASLQLLSRRDRRLLGAAMVAQMLTSILDLLGVLLLGMVGALAVSAVDGRTPPGPVMKAVSFLGLGNASQGSLVAVFSGLAAALLLTKSIVSPILMSRVLKFLARREAIVSARLTKDLLAQPLTFVQRRSTQDTAFALVQGTNSATVSILGQLATASSELALLVLLGVALLAINPGVAVGAIIFFAVVSIALQRLLGSRAGQYARERQKADVASLVAVQEVLGAYREVTVTNRRSLYVERIESQRVAAAEAAAGAQMINILPKYVSEAALVAGSFLLAGSLFATQSIAAAAGTFALFLATATRVMPSLLRLQTAALAIRSAAGNAQPTFKLAEDLGYSVDGPRAADPPLPHAEGNRPFTPRIDVSNVSFTYPESDEPAIRGIDLTVEAGASVALVGRSGAGKSTLADIILGVLPADKGMVTVSGISPGEAVQRWPGSVAYVPQDVTLTNETVRANVALGLPRELTDDQQVWEALRRANLEDYLRAQPEGLDAEIGERGLRLSGGQRQRLGIARALFTRPQLLVLDEATSALDAETEQSITHMLESLDEDVTTVIIAHRLSTIRNSDQVVYLDKGVAVAKGSFTEVCDRVPALQTQAELMGLQSA
jgi:ABC-type multidrug transport system fused ATPase/permease subunit